MSMPALATCPTRVTRFGRYGVAGQEGLKAAQQVAPFVEGGVGEPAGLPVEAVLAASAAGTGLRFAGGVARCRDLVAGSLDLDVGDEFGGWP